MSALTPGLSALLDTVITRFDADKVKREFRDELDLGRFRGPQQVAGQIALFDVDRSGNMLSFAGGQL